MEINPADRISMSTPVAGDTALERERRLRLRRAATEKRHNADPAVPEASEILDELPPDAVLRMMAELERIREGDM